MEPGTVLGPYVIDRELGSGGMGQVYAAVVEGRAAGLEVGTRVALKVVHPHLLETEGFFKRFLREGEIGQSVRHVNVVQTFDCDATGDAHFLVMEYVEGQTLRELLGELRRVPEELCRHIAQEMCRGLEAIHAVGVIHRDVKPENVIVARSAAACRDDAAASHTTSGRARDGNVSPDSDVIVKLMDLGVARLADEAMRLSQTGAFVGSIQYAAPECFRDQGRVVDGRADLHALGLVLYELVTGSNPYAAEDVQRTLRRVIDHEPRRLGAVDPQVSPFFEEVVGCLLRKDPADRFADATTLLSVLEQGEDSAWWRARSHEIREETRRPLRRVRIPRETAVYGRDDEVARLRSLFDQAAGGDGQVLLIEGEAGIGKSRLVDELVSRLQAEDAPLNFLFGSYPPGGAATASGAFSTAYREQFGDAGSGVYLQATPRLVEAFDALLRGDAHPEGAAALRTQSLQTCFVHVTRALALERPTVVLIDDLHFAPDEGRALFSALASAVAGHPVLLIGTTRAGISESWVGGLTRLDHASHLTLDRLGPKDLVRLLTDALGSPDLAAELAGPIALRSDGNPFFVFEMVMGLREGQFITRGTDGRWITTKSIRDIMIPSSVLDLVAARVAELGEEERDLVDAAACCGFTFDPSLVADALGMPMLPTLKRFAQIERKHRLVRSVGREMVFDHHQIQESLYLGLMEQIREHYHAAIGDALERRVGGGEISGGGAYELCRHFLAGAVAPRAAPYLDAALAHLTVGHLHATVAELTGQVLAVPGMLVGAQRLDVLLQREGSLASQGHADEQRVVIDEALALATERGDPTGIANAQRRLGQLLLRSGEPAEAEPVLRDALAAAEKAGDRNLVGALLTNLGNLCDSLGRMDEARALHEQSLAVAREIGRRAGEATCLGNLGICAWKAGRNEQARELLERAIDIAREIDDTVNEATTVGNLGIVMSALGRYDDAARLYRRHAELAREVGSRTGEAFAIGNLGTVYDARGRLAAAHAQFERCIALCREIGLPGLESVALLNVGTSLVQQGATAEGEAVLRRVLALAERLGRRTVVASTLAHLAEVAQQRGELAEAERCYREAIALHDDLGERDSAASATRRSLAELLHGSGRIDAARTVLAEARAIAVDVERPDAQVMVALVDAALFDVDPAQASALYAEHAGDLNLSVRLDAEWRLYRLTGERAHLDAARRLLDELADHAAPEHRATLLAAVPLHRDIITASGGPGATSAQ